MIPGVQKPHWLAPTPVKASAQRPLTSSAEALEGGHRAPGHPADRGDAGHPGGAVHPDRAAAALALGAAAVLGGVLTELLAQHLEQRRRRRRRPRPARRPVEGRQLIERWRAGPAGAAERRVRQLKEEPQPQVRVALGFVMWNPAPCSPSL